MINDKENAHPTVGAVGQAAETGTTSRAGSYSNSNFTTGRSQIARLLSHGQENAVPLRDLVSMTRMDGRTVRAQIQAERLDGTPILSDNRVGYFLPANDEERRRFIRSMKHRAREIERVADAIERDKG